MNAIRVIHPYWWNGSLVFDDDAAGLRREPFVAGADVVLGLLASKVDGCDAGFTLRFSDSPFPGYSAEMVWSRPDYGGNWYTCDIDGVSHEGWLCPALLKYFESPPRRIFIEIAKSKQSLSDMWQFARSGTDTYA